LLEFQVVICATVNYAYYYVTLGRSLIDTYSWG